MCVVWKGAELIARRLSFRAWRSDLKFLGFWLGVISGKNGTFEFGICILFPPMHVTLYNLLLVKD